MRQKLLLLFTLFIVVNSWGQTSFTSTSATTAWNASRWNNASDAAPYTSAFTANNAVSFTSGTYTFASMGASTNVGNVTVASGVQVTFTSVSGSFATGGSVRTINVGSGGLFDLNGNSYSTAAGTGLIKSGDGVFGTGGGTFTGGFTLNAGTVVARGTTGLGGGATNVLTLNGGTIAANNTRDFASTRFGGGIVIGGNVQFGEMATVVSIASSTADLSFANNVSLGGSLRTLTLGNGGTQTFSGVISNSGSNGLTFTANNNGTGRFDVTNTANTFSGPVNINGNGTGVAEVRFTSDGSIGNTSNTININGGRLATLNSATYTITSSRGIQVGNTAGTSISTPGAGVLTYNGVISDLSGSTPGAWAKQGAGTLALGGVSTYTGTTSINNGTIRLTTGNNRLPAATVVSLGQAASANVGTLDLNGINQTIGGLNSTTGTNASSLANNTITSSAAATLTVNGAGSYGDGTDANSGIISGAISLVKSGSGILLLADANTYTGTTTVSGGTLQLSKTGGTTIPVASAITVNSGGTLQISSNQTLATLTVDAGGIVTVDAGAILTVTGTTTNNGSILVKSTASASGAFINSSAGEIPNVTLQQWITGQRGYRILSNPFNSALTPVGITAGIGNGGTSSITIGGANDIKTYNTDNTWSGSVSSIAANKPYSVFIRGLNSEVTGLSYTAGPTAFAYSVTGTLNDNSIDVTPNASNFTIVGNPFAAPVTSQALTGGVSQAYYVYEIPTNIAASPAARTKAGAWSAQLTSGTAAGNVIPMMGVIAYNSGNATPFSISSSSISANALISNKIFGESALTYLELHVAKDGVCQDKLFVRADANASEASNERMDLLKIINDVTNIYTIALDKSRLAVDARKGLEANIPVGISSPAGSYTFTVASNNLPNASNVYLLDKLTNTKTVLTPGATYSFAITADATTKGDERFELGAVKTAIVDVINNEAFAVKVLGNVVNNAVTVQVKGAKSAVQITVVDVQGKIISTTTSNKEINTVSLASGSGLYLVKVTDGDNSIVNKVVKP